MDHPQQDARQEGETSLEGPVVGIHDPALRDIGDEDGIAHDAKQSGKKIRNGLLFTKQLFEQRKDKSSLHLL